MTFLDDLVRSPEAVVTLLGFTFAIISFFLASRRDRALQKRENYLKLEFESVALFRFCSENPNVPRFLEGKLPATDENAKLDETTYWFVCQTLNLFEIIISFRKERIISSEIFSTWVAWFYELATAKRFKEYWNELSFHYLGDLSEMIDPALGRPPLEELLESGNLEPLNQFYHDVARAMNDQSILRHLKGSLVHMRARMQSRVVGRSP